MGRPVALLDIKNVANNQNLLDSLKRKGIKDVYLFKDITFNANSIQEELALIRALKAKGFTVHGLISPNDLFWSIPEGEFSRLSLDFERDGALKTKGPYRIDRVKALEFRFDHIEDEIASAAIPPGIAFNAVEKALHQADTRESEGSYGKMFNFYAKSAVCVDQAQKAAKQMSTPIKLMLLLAFIATLTKKSPWVSSIVIVDDRESANQLQAFTNSPPVNLRSSIPPTTPFPVDPDDKPETYEEILNQHLKKRNLSTCLKKIEAYEHGLKRSQMINPVMNRDGSKRWAFEDLDSTIRAEFKADNQIAQIISGWLDKSEREDKLTNRQVLSQHRNKFYEKNRPMVPTASMQFIQELIFEHIPPNPSLKVNAYVRKIEAHIKSLEWSFYNPIMRSAEGEIYVFKTLRNHILMQGNDENIAKIIQDYLKEEPMGLQNNAILASHRNRFYSQQRPEIETSSQTFIKTLLNDLGSQETPETPMLLA